MIDKVATESDIEKNRRESKWTSRELVGRLLWVGCSPLFRYSPKIMWFWRRWLLRLFGAKIEGQVQIHPSVKIFIPWNLEVGEWTSIGFDSVIYNLGMIKIGKRVTISQRSHLCAGSHDFRDPSMTLLKLSITIEDDSWICTDTFVSGNVTVSKGAVVGACSCVIKDVQPWSIVGGNPAKHIGQRIIRVES